MESAREIFEFTAAGKKRRVDPGMVDLRWRKELMMIDEESLFNRFSGPKWLEDYDRLGEDEFRKANPTVDDAAIRMALNSRDEATMEMLPLLYRVYGLEPYTFDADTGEERGVTAGEMFAIRGQFLEWQAGVKKNIDPAPPSDTPIPVPSES